MSIDGKSMKVDFNRGHDINTSEATPDPKHLDASNYVHENIEIEGSNIGVVNTGVIHDIESAIGRFAALEDDQLAAAFFQVTKAVVDARDAAPAKTDEILEGLSALSEEAAKPPEERRLALMKVILETLKLGRRDDPISRADHDQRLAAHCRGARPRLLDVNRRHTQASRDHGHVVRPR
jgi:hypothetical protein